MRDYGCIAYTSLLTILDRIGLDSSMYLYLQNYTVGFPSAGGHMGDGMMGVVLLFIILIIIQVSNQSSLHSSPIVLK